VIDYTFHPEADAEFVAAGLYYDAQVVGLGASFVDAVGRAVSLIRQHPDVGSPIGPQLRRMLISGFPYAVIYRRGSDSLLIVAVAHLRRRSDYWLGRV
jgi:plasmid stabilization system protein ParE